MSQANQAAVPRRSCRQPVAAGRAERGAREARQRRDRRRRAQSGRGPRDRGRHQETGSGRAAIDHRRRIPPLLVASRLPVGARRRRKARHGQRHRLCRGHDAQRRRQGHRQDRLFRSSDDRAFQIPQSANHAHAENDHSGAVGAVWPPEPDADRQVGLSDARQSLRRSRPGLQESGARLRRCRLPLSAARRSVHRHAVRSEISPADEGSRRRSGSARHHLRRSHQRGDFRHPGRHDGDDASVPRQLQIDLHGLRRLRRDAGSAVRPHQGARLFHGIRHRARRRLRAAASACTRIASRCSAW